MSTTRKAAARRSPHLAVDCCGSVSINATLRALLRRRNRDMDRGRGLAAAALHADERNRSHAVPLVVVFVPFERARVCAVRVCTLPIVGAGAPVAAGDRYCVPGRWKMLVSTAKT